MGSDFDGSYAEFAVLHKSIISSFESDLPWGIYGSLLEMLHTFYGSLYTALKIKKGKIHLKSDVFDFYTFEFLMMLK